MNNTFWDGVLPEEFSTIPHTPRDISLRAQLQKFMDKYSLIFKSIVLLLKLNIYLDEH